MDISKQIDKKGGNDYSKQFAIDLKQAREGRNLTMKYCDDKYCNGSTNWSWYEGRKDGCRVPDYQTYLQIIKEFPELEKYKELIKEAERKVIGKGKAGLTKGTIGNFAGTTEFEITAPATNLAKQWQGWGTCLKPSFEPIIIARKPFKGSLVDNVIKWGIGGLNIDECRVGTNDKLSIHSTSKNTEQNDMYKWSKEREIFTRPGQNLGRFPANTILTYDQITFDEVCGGFPNTKSTPRTQTIGGTGGVGQATNFQRGSETSPYNDSGSASRYFYCAKASAKDRDEGLDGFDSVKCSMMALNDNIDSNGNFTGMLAGRETSRKNIHPTVKPTELMQYLVRLVSPKGAIILDPFMGSGSTGKAVAYENKERQANYNFIGIELNKEYCDIAEARIKYVKESE